MLSAVHALRLRCSIHERRFSPAAGSSSPAHPACMSWSCQHVAMGACGAPRGVAFDCSNIQVEVAGQLPACLPVAGAVASLLQQQLRPLLLLCRCHHAGSASTADTCCAANAVRHDTAPRPAAAAATAARGLRRGSPCARRAHELHTAPARWTLVRGAAAVRAAP